MAQPYLPFPDRPVGAQPSEQPPLLNYENLARMRVEPRFLETANSLVEVFREHLPEVVNQSFPQFDGALPEQDRLRSVMQVLALIPGLVPAHDREYSVAAGSLIGLLDGARGNCDPSNPLAQVSISTPLAQRDFSALKHLGMRVLPTTVQVHEGVLNFGGKPRSYITTLMNVMSPEQLAGWGERLDLHARSPLEIGDQILRAAVATIVPCGFLVIAGIADRNDVGLTPRALEALGLTQILDKNRDLMVLLRST